MDNLSFGLIRGLPGEELEKLQELVECFNLHLGSNHRKEKYYEGKIALRDVNLGIALPKGLQDFKIGCEWGAKTVDVLASRSMFDGFVGQSGQSVAALQRIVSGNRLVAEYKKACRDELKLGCCFATLSADDVLGCKIRFHSANTAAALWSGEKGRIDCGFAIIDTAPDEKEENRWIPSLVNYYTDNAIWELRRDGDVWTAIQHPHIMGRPLMVPLTWNATNKKPFGRSRIKYTTRGLIDGYVRTIANATIGLEFCTAPQKYLLGVTDEQYDALINQKFKQYVGSMLVGTNNPETGEIPHFGQLAQGNIQPHVEMMRMLATQMSATSGLTITDVGVVNDANPTSSDAILAQSQTLVSLAEELNTGNGDALNLIGMMAQAITRNISLSELTDEETDVIAHFKNPAMPSVSVTADAAIKIASVRPNFSGTNTFLEMIGFGQADIRRITAEEQRVRGQTVLNEEFSDGDQ